jgi:hypothetical protein
MVRIAVKKIKLIPRIGIILKGKVTVFHRPHPGKEMDKGAVKNMREFLELSEVKPC